MPYASKEKRRECARRWAEKNRHENRDLVNAKQREYRLKHPIKKLTAAERLERNKIGAAKRIALYLPKYQAAAKRNLVKANANSHTPEAQAKRTASLQASEKAKAAMRMVGKKYQKERVAAALQNPRYASTKQHASAKIWRLRSPANVIYEFRNVVVFVRENPQLFSEYQLEKPSSKCRYCRAVTGLQSLSPDNKKNPGAWYGWTVVSIYERRFNDGHDLIGRKQGNGALNHGEDAKR